MNGLRAAALASLLAGLALLGYAAVQGSVRVGVFLIVPFAYGTGIVPFLGMLLLTLAAFLWFAGLAPRGAPGDAEAWAPPGARPARRPDGESGDGDDAGDRDGARPGRRSASGGVVLVGPIPIVWGSDRRVLPWMIGAGAALLLLALLLTASR